MLRDSVTVPLRPRHALYFAPAPDSPLGRAGRSWLKPSPPAVDGFAGPELAAITAEARHYGFHATLKAPFELAPGRDEAGLVAAAEAFAATEPEASSPPLVVGEIAGFLALVPGSPAPELNRFAARVVDAFEPFRAPLSAADRARRRPERLAPAERDYLDRFGYPYVMDAFRFHMTLSCRLEAERREPLARFLERWFAPALAAPFAVDRLAVFRQDEREAPFREIAAFPLRADRHAAVTGI